MKDYIIDIDGTVLLGVTELNNSKIFIEYLQEAGSNYLLATNSIKSHAKQVERLGRVGINVFHKQIYTPIDSINRYIKDHKIRNVLVVGSDQEIFQIEAQHSVTNPELIILLDFEKGNISYYEIQAIIDKVENGVKIITASRSPFYLNNGKKQIDTGAFVHLIESVTGNTILVFGKPSTDYFLNAMKILGSEKDNTVVIGDDWRTDILGAKEVGFGSILVKSGKYMKGDEIKSNPDLFIDDLMILK